MNVGPDVRREQFRGGRGCRRRLCSRSARRVIEFLAVPQPRGERFELQIAEHADQPGRVPLRRAERVKINVERHGGVDRDQVLRKERGLPVGDELLAEPFLRDLFRMFVDRLHGAVLLYEGDGRLLSHPRDAGDVVGFVADQAEDVDDPVGRDAEFLHDPLFFHDLRVPAGLSGLVHLDHGGNQLHEILVSRHHHRHDPLFLGAPRKRADDIVRFETGKFEKGSVERADHLFQFFHLCGHVFRHLLPGGFVGGEELVAERRLLRVEHDRDVIRLLVVEDLHERGDEAVDRARILPLAVDQRAGDEREVGPVGERHAVEEEEPFCCAHVVRCGESGRSRRRTGGGCET